MNVKVALAQDFLSNLSKIPASIQTKVLRWALKFQSDPTANGINYETIKGARDKNLRSVRIDQDWRGIVFKPDKGDVYVLMYVDKHDDAYHWAETRRVAINPVTGAMQLFAVERAEEALEAEVSQQEEPTKVTCLGAHTYRIGVGPEQPGLGPGSNAASPTYWTGP
jgi:mRNA-degrading endonuclease RelE of RelBE toxin-antitoxin system